MKHLEVLFSDGNCTFHDILNPFPDSIMNSIFQLLLPFLFLIFGVGVGIEMRKLMVCLGQWKSDKACQAKNIPQYLQNYVKIKK